MDLAGMVLALLHVAVHHGLDRGALQVRPGKRSRVEQHFLHVLGESVAVPNTKMIILVPAQEETLHVEGRKTMIELGHRRAHAVVEFVFRLERNLEIRAGKSADHPISATNAAVAPNARESGISVGDQSQRVVMVGRNVAPYQRGIRRAEGSANDVIVEKRGARRKLGLLQRGKAIVMEWGLCEGDKRGRVALAEF